MSAIIVPIEIQLTERSQAILAALSGAIGTTQEPATASASAVDLQPGEHYAGVVLDESGQVTHHLMALANATQRDVRAGHTQPPRPHPRCQAHASARACGQG